MGRAGVERGENICKVAETRAEDGKPGSVISEDALSNTSPSSTRREHIDNCADSYLVYARNVSDAVEDRERKIEWRELSFEPVELGQFCEFVVITSPQYTLIIGKKVTRAVRVGVVVEEHSDVYRGCSPVLVSRFP